MEREMTSNKPPLEPWVAVARTCVIYLGFAWPAIAVLGTAIFGGRDSVIWALIGVTFAFAVFVPGAFMLSLLVPTVKARLFGVPLLAVLYISWLSSGSAINYPSGLLMLPWLGTITALTLQFPEVRTVRRFYARLFLKQPDR